MLSAAVGIGGTLLVQHRDDELQVSTVGMATYFAEAWGHAIFKAYNDDKTGLNEGILISDGPLPTRSSRSTGEPIMTVVMVPVNGKLLVDWNATVRANNSRSHHYHHTDDVKNPSQSSQQNWPGFFTKQLRR